MDAIYTPAKRVSYRVENMRVGERTDFDRIFLEIETDGTIDAEDAFRQASELLVNHFNLLAETFKPKAEIPSKVDEKPVAKKKSKDKKPAKEKHAKKKKGKKTK